MERNMAMNIIKFYLNTYNDIIIIHDCVFVCQTNKLTYGKTCILIVNAQTHTHTRKKVYNEMLMCIHEP